MDENYFRENFNSTIKDMDGYKKWLEQYKGSGRDIEADKADYDIQGYYNENPVFNPDGGHFTDKFKKPNHPSFSIESMYHGTLRPDEGNYVGGAWVGDGGQFNVSSEMLKESPATFLQNYFKKVEPNVKLGLPSGLNQTTQFRKTLPKLGLQGEFNY